MNCVEISLLIFYILAISLTINKTKYESNLYALFCFIISAGIFFIFYLVKPDTYSSDYLSYYYWFTKISAIDNIADFIDYHPDFLFSGLLKIISWFGVNQVVFDVGTVVLFLSAILYEKKWFKDGYQFGVFLIILVPSRLFFEYTSNTMRSFLAIFIIADYMMIGLKTVKSIKNNIFMYIGYYTHAKVSLIVFFLRPLFDFITFSKKIQYVLYFTSLVLLFSKYLFDVRISGVVELMSVYQFDDVDIRSDKIDLANTLSLSLLIQILIYIYYPVWILILKENADKSIMAFLLATLMIISITYPEYILSERLCQISFLVSWLLTSRNDIDIKYLLPVFITNIYTITSFI